jgi:predicted tellurium resistance membrane protein TerC
MRGASIGLLVIGIVLGLAGLVNHYAIKANPIAHTSTIVGAVGAVLVVVGVIMMVMGGKSSAA